MAIEFKIRLANSADAADLADIHQRSWHFAYGNCVSTDILKKHTDRFPMIWEGMVQNNTDIHYSIEADNNTVGFFTIMPARDADLDKSVGELVGLYLAPDYIGLGLGRRAMDAIKQMLSHRGYQHISLWVLSENYRAKAFYEKSGFRADGFQKDSGLLDIKEERYIFSF